MGMVCDKNIKK